MTPVIGWGLVSALLVLTVQAEVPAEELTEIQEKVVQLVMEKFHEGNVRNAYRMTSIVKAKQESLSAGIFANVEFLVRQTSCSQQDWSNPDCKVVQNGKTYNCFGCFKFEQKSHAVKYSYTSCTRPKRVQQTQRDNECKKVENWREIIPGVHTPFSRRGGSSQDVE